MAASDDGNEPAGPRSQARRALRLMGLPLGWTLIAAVRAYQFFFSPLFPPMCRFQPTCSQYMVEAIRKRGPVAGVLKGLWRLVRCNPFCRGGYDPVEGPGHPTDGGRGQAAPQ